MEKKDKIIWEKQVSEKLPQLNTILSIKLPGSHGKKEKHGGKDEQLDKI